MERQIERACGLDVHRDTVAACVRVPDGPGQRTQHVHTFGTTAAELLALRDWLEGHGVTHVAMESTGVYCKPVFYVLEEAFTCLLVNAAHVKQVPGRKTDVLDGGRRRAGPFRGRSGPAGYDSGGRDADGGGDRGGDRRGHAAVSERPAPGELGMASIS